MTAGVSSGFCYNVKRCWWNVGGEAQSGPSLMVLNSTIMSGVLKSSTTLRSIPSRYAPPPATPTKLRLSGEFWCVPTRAVWSTLMDQGSSETPSFQVDHRLQEPETRPAWTKVTYWLLLIYGRRGKYCDCGEDGFTFLVLVNHEPMLLLPHPYLSPNQAFSS